MGRRNKENRTGLGHPPGASRHDLLEEGIDEIANDENEEVVLPVHHGIQLLLALVRGSLLELGLIARRRLLVARLGGHDGRAGSVGIDETRVAMFDAVDEGLMGDAWRGESRAQRGRVGCWGREERLELRLE